MDNFVTRPPTWKTMNYASISKATTYGRSSIGTKPVPTKQEPGQKSAGGALTKEKTQVTAAALRPLQEKQQLGVERSDRRLSIRDDRLLKLFSSQPDQPLVDLHAFDSGCSSQSSDSFHDFGGGATTTFGQQRSRSQQLVDDENTPPVSAMKQLSFNEPLDNSQSTTLVDAAVPSDSQRVEEVRPCTPQHEPAMYRAESPLNRDHLREATTNCMPNDHPLMQRIQRDLNSPSAALRIRALQALKTPSKSSYTHFDVSHTEQNIISAEERRTPPPPKNIQEVMSNIIVYVEVRTGEDNRSEGVKKVISALGAKVNDKLLRTTTHVIFKDGLLSTYKKAKNWQIPIVSILWIEACKNRCKICDPKEYQISNIDRYENPELYDKMKRHKSMQPDSEANKRIRKPATPKEATPKTGALKKTTPLMTGSTPTSSHSKKTDIRRFFQQLGANISDMPNTPVNNGFNVAESPATQLLNKINGGTYSPLQATLMRGSGEHGDDHAASTPQPQNVKKTLNFVASVLGSPIGSPQVSPNKIKRIAGRRRSTMQHTACNDGLTDMSLSQTAADMKSPPEKSTRKSARRRNSIHVATNMNISSVISTSASGNMKTTKSGCTVIAEQCDSIVEEEEVAIKEDSVVATTPRRNARRRQTTFSTKTLDICETLPEQPVSVRATSRRRTLFTPQNMEQSNSNEMCLTASKSKTNCQSTTLQSDTLLSVNSTTCAALTPIPSNVISSTLVQHESPTVLETPPQPAKMGTLLAEHANANVFSSTRQPGRRRTLFDVSMDIITQRLQNINQSARRSIARPCAIDVDVRRNSLEKETPTMEQSAAPIECVSSPMLPSEQKRKSIFNASTTQLPPAQTATAQTVNTATAVESTPPPIVKKKRKLFVPNDGCLLNETPPPTTTPASTIQSISSTVSITSSGFSTPSIDNVKRRRNLLTQPQSESKHSSVGSVKSLTRAPRRSTMDFESAKKTRKLLDAKRLTKKSSTSTSESGDMPQKRAPETFLVYTNMHKEQIEIIKEAVAKLGRFELKSNIDDSTTHIVSLEPRRTLNLLRALLRGLWILEFTWIKESLRAGKWLSEEQYELRDFSRAVEICRAERQAFGSVYRSELFSGLGPFYISNRCGPIPRESYVELIELGGGKVADNRNRAKYILGDMNKFMENKVYITPFWILDSITQMQLQKFNRYAAPTMRSSEENIPNRQVNGAFNGSTSNSQEVVSNTAAVQLALPGKLLQKKSHV